MRRSTRQAIFIGICGATFAGGIYCGFQANQQLEALPESLETIRSGSENISVAETWEQSDELRATIFYGIGSVTLGGACVYTGRKIMRNEG
jgi:hypothetical protein